MLLPTNKLIVNLHEANQKYAQDINNTIKIDFSKIKDFNECQAQRIHLCRNKECQAVLSAPDKESLMKVADYRDNLSNFQQAYRLKAEELNTFGNDIEIWLCRFCGIHQPIKRADVDFIDKPTKFLLNNNKSQDKNEPIILFLIDTSSSMEQTFEVDHNRAKGMLQLVQNSPLVTKCKAKQYEYHKRLSRIHQGGEVVVKEGIFTKKQLLLGLVSKVMREMKFRVKSQKQQQGRKIGFLFFNEHIFLSGDGRNPNFTILTDVSYDLSNFNADSYYESSPSKDRFKSVRFDDYNELFEFGTKYSKDYQTYIKDLNAEDMDLNDVKSSGKTALGPCLAVALGIASKHAQGSTIVVVTDGKANYGILESQNEYPDTYRSVKKHLQEMKCSLGLLQWFQKEPIRQRKNPKSKQSVEQQFETDSYLNRFIANNKEVASKIQITLDIDEETLNLHSNSLLTLSFRKIIAVVNSIKLIVSVQFIEFEKSKFEETVIKDINLIHSDQSTWINIKLKKDKIDNDCYQFPIYTQFLLKYFDVQNKRHLCFVSQVKHELSKSLKKVVEYVNFENVQEYFDFQDIKNYSEKNSIRSVERSIRNYMREESMSMKSNHRLNYGEINSKNEAYMRSFKHTSKQNNYN